MKIITLIILTLSSIFLGYLGLINLSLYNYLSGNTDKIYIKNFDYKSIADKIKGKNYLAKDTKIIVVNNYIITKKTPISGVVEINNNKKTFNNLTLDKLSKIANVGKIYINKIGKIELQSYIIIENYKGNDIVSASIEERSASKKK